MADLPPNAILMPSLAPVDCSLLSEHNRPKLLIAGGVLGTTLVGNLLFGRLGMLAGFAGSTYAIAGVAKGFGEAWGGGPDTGPPTLTEWLGVTQRMFQSLLSADSACGKQP